MDLLCYMKDYTLNLNNKYSSWSLNLLSQNKTYPLILINDVIFRYL